MAGLARSRRSEHAWSVEHKQRQRIQAALAERANDEVTQADIDEPSWGALVRIGSPRRAHDA